MRKPISTANMGKDEWRQLRRELGIGGSEAAAILGLSKFSTPLRVYMDKLGEAPEVEETESIRIGNDLEDYVAKRFNEATGLNVRKHRQIMFHPEHDWMFANIDRKVYGEGVTGFVGLECKTTNAYNPTDFEGGEIQPNYYCQCQHYMAVTGAKYWYLAVLVLGVEFHVFKVDRNDEFIDSLIAAEDEFWNDHVVKEVPPLPTGEKVDSEMVNIITREEIDDGEEADLTDMKNDFDVMFLLKNDKKNIEKQIAEIENRIKLRVGRCAKGQVGSYYKLSYNVQERVSVDRKKLEKELPDVFKKYCKVSTSRVLRTSEITNKEA